MNRHDGLAVLGVLLKVIINIFQSEPAIHFIFESFLKIGATNAELDKVLDHCDQIKFRHEQAQIDSTINLRGLMPGTKPI